MSLACCATLVGATQLFRAWQRNQETTLRAPIAWALLAWAAVGLVSWIEMREVSLGSSSTWRYAAALMTLCPTMALLGAKRPQDRGWQWIVVTLWLVLMIPAAHRWAFSPRGTLEVHPAWRGFCTLLIGVGVVNYLGTSHALAALAVAAGQVIALGSHGPLAYLTPRVPAVAWSTACFVLGTLLASRRRNALSIKHDGAWRSTVWDQPWRAFRDAYGTVWSLRVMERINQVAHQQVPPVELTWQGFVNVAAPTDARPPHDDVPIGDELELNIRTTLRRFVSNAWIDARLAAPSRRSAPNDLGATY